MRRPAEHELTELPHAPIRVQLRVSTGVTAIDMDLRDLVFQHFQRLGMPRIPVDGPVEVRVLAGVGGQWYVAVPDVDE